MYVLYVYVLFPLQLTARCQSDCHPQLDGITMEAASDGALKEEAGPPDENEMVKQTEILVLWNVYSSRF